MTLSRPFLLPLALALGLFLALATTASAASYYYPPTYYQPSYHYPQSQTLWVHVYVQGNYSYNSYQNYQPNDFTIRVDGNNPAPSSFRGAAGGRAVSIEPGNYSVSVQDLRGYTPSYSGCNGYIGNGQTAYCTITLSGGSYNNYPPYNPPTYYPPVYQPPVTYAPPTIIQKGYVPGFPSTGFAPVSAESIAFAAALLLAAGIFFYPYARKAFVAVLR